MFMSPALMASNGKSAKMSDDTPSPGCSLKTPMLTYEALKHYRQASLTTARPNQQTNKH